jgi:hypothetical protein
MIGTGVGINGFTPCKMMMPSPVSYSHPNTLCYSHSIDVRDIILHLSTGGFQLGQTVLLLVEDLRHLSYNVGL